MARADADFITGKPIRIPKALRSQLETAIQAHLEAVEKLTGVLDLADGEPDIEPSLGAQDPAWENTNQERWAASNDDDREGDDHDGREPDVDDEPSLAYTLDVDQTRALRHATGCRSLSGGNWFGMSEDLEAEHDGREPDADAESSLGSLPCVGAIVADAPAVGFSQSHWALGATDDTEEQVEDEGSVERCCE